MSGDSGSQTPGPGPADGDDVSPSQHPEIHDHDLEFEFHVHELFTEVVAELRDALNRVADAIQPETLRGPLFAITHELAVNSLKALYKRIYVEYFLKPTGLAEIAYKDWLQLFRAEIEAHRAENFARLCKENGELVHVIGRVIGENFRIQVENDGLPSAIEWERIQSALRFARTVDRLDALFMDDEDANREGAGLGLPLIIISLRGLGVDPENFVIEMVNGRTVSRVDIPLSLMKVRRPAGVRVLGRTRRTMALAWNIYSELELGIARFDSRGNLKEVSRRLLEDLGMAPNNPMEFQRLLPVHFFADVFHGEAGLRRSGRFENYRLYLNVREERVLFNISGYTSASGRVETLWQRVDIQDMAVAPAEGPLDGNLQLQQLIEPYMPSPVLNRARDAVRRGEERLTEESRPLTVCFADLADFPRRSGELEPDAYVELLNIAIGILVHSINRHGGTIERFLGDAVLYTFDEPLKAVIASVEIQSQFEQLNHFRGMGNQRPVHVRVGISTGTVIIGSVGTRDHRIWTPMGDVVDCAANLKKRAMPGSVLVDENTREATAEKIEAQSFAAGNGNAASATAFSVIAVHFEADGQDFSLRISPGL